MNEKTIARGMRLFAVAYDDHAAARSSSRVSHCLDNTTRPQEGAEKFPQLAENTTDGRVKVESTRTARYTRTGHENGGAERGAGRVAPSVSKLGRTRRARRAKRFDILH